MTSSDADQFRYQGALPPARFNLARYCLSDAAQRWPDKQALIVVGDKDCESSSQVWSFNEAETCVLRIAHFLKMRGIAAGERLVIRLDNHSEYAFLFFGAIAAGVVPVPVSSQLTAHEADFILRDSGACAMALDDSLPIGDIRVGIQVFTQSDITAVMREGELADYVDSGADDPAFLVYTSGTTADPKGVLHAQRSAWGRRPMVEGWYGLKQSDRMLHAGAFNWTYTLGTGLQDPWANGATTIVYTGEKSPAVWPRLIERYSVTLFAAVPTVYRQILKYCDIEAFDLSSLRHGLTAGEALPESVREEWQRRTGKQLYEALGMSEISTYISSCASSPPKAGTVGRAQPGRSIAILPLEGGDTPLPQDEASGREGLLGVHRSDPGLMLGYWNRQREEETVYHGAWFCGGDIATIDEDGYVRHLGRNNELMNALGTRVSPFEVEHVLEQHKDVLEVAAAEISVTANVSVICAFVVARDGSHPSASLLTDFALQKLADYKVPKAFCFVDGLPKTANGKVRRGDLQDLYDQKSRFHSL